MKTIAVVVLLAYCCTGCHTLERRQTTVEPNRQLTTGTLIRETSSEPRSTNNVGPPAEYKDEKVYTWRGKPREWRWIGDGWPTLSNDGPGWTKREVWTMVGMLAGFVVVSSLMGRRDVHQNPGPPGSGCPQWFLDNCTMCDCSNRP